MTSNPLWSTRVCWVFLPIFGRHEKAFNGLPRAPLSLTTSICVVDGELTENSPDLTPTHVVSQHARPGPVTHSTFEGSTAPGVDGRVCVLSSNLAVLVLGSGGVGTEIWPQKLSLNENQTGLVHYPCGV